MADEAVVTDLLGNGGDVITYTIATGTLIPKGSIMELEDLRTVKIISAHDKPIAGIAASEHTAGAEDTQIGVYTNCIAKVKCGGGAIAFGDEVVASNGGVNEMSKYDTLDHEKGYTLGYSLETAADGETFLVKVKK